MNEMRKLMEAVKINEEVAEVWPEKLVRAVAREVFRRASAEAKKQWERLSPESKQHYGSWKQYMDSIILDDWMATPEFEQLQLDAWDLARAMLQDSMNRR